MEKPSVTDPAFGKFLEDLKKQNNQSFATQLLQLKYEREVAKEDNDKREKQLDEVVKALQGVKEAISGNKVSSKSNQSDPLAKKLSSVKVNPDDRTFSEAFKEIKSALTGGTFTAAKGRYSEEFVKAGKGTEEEGMKAYDKIVELEKKLEKSQEYGFEGSKEDRAELAKLKGGSLSVANPKVQKRPDGESPAAVSSPNAEADNIQSTQEIIADNSKTTVELLSDIKTINEKQLKELKLMSAALAPKTPSDLPEGRLKPTPGAAAGGAGGDGGGGGIGLGDVLSTGGGLGKTLKNAGKGALSLGGKALKFMGGKGGAIAGAALAVGAGAYTAYKGYTAADDSKDAKLKEVQAKVDSGEMKPEEAAAARKKIGNTATVEKSGAVGEGTGMAAGAVAGMKAGAMLGAFGGPIGAGVGALAGGALGAFAGSKGGKYIGEKVGSGINAAKGFFGGKTDTPGAATKEAMSNVTSTSTKTSTSIKFNESEFAQKDPENYKKYTEFKKKRREEIARKDPFFKTDPRSAYTVAESEAEDEATAKFKAEIEAVNAGKIATTESKVTGGPGAKNPASTVVKKDSGKAEKLSGIKKEFQENEAKVAAARAKVKEFEKANQFDVKPKGDIESGITPGKFNDPKKQAEYDKLRNEELALGKQSTDIEGKYKEADVGKDVKKMSAAYAESLNKKNAEANARGSTYFGKAHRTDYKEGEETELNEFEKRRKYTAALKERGVEGRDISVMNPEGSYDSQISKELREKNVAGGPGAKNPAPAVEKKPIDATAPGTAAAVAMGAAQAAPSKGSGGDKFRSAQASALNQARQMVKNGEVGPGNIDEVTAQIMANVEGVSPQSADIIEKAVRLELQKGVANSSDPSAKKPVNTDLGDADLGDDTGVTTLNGIPKSRLNELAMAEAKKYGRKTPNYDDKQAAQKLAKRELPSAAVPAVEKKPVDAVAPGDATAAALAPGMAKGGSVEDGADYIVGEKGPELFMPFKDGVVIPNDVSKKIAGGKIPLEKGGIALADDSVDHYDKLSSKAKEYQKIRLGLDSLDKIRGPGGGNVFDDISPEAKEKEARFRKMAADLEKEISPAEKRLVDSNLTDRYRPPQSEAELDARGPSLAERYNSKKANTGSEVVKASIENADLNRGATGGGSNNTVVSNNVSTNNTTSYVPIKASPRSDGSSSVDRYQNRIAAY